MVKVKTSCEHPLLVLWLSSSGANRLLSASKQTGASVFSSILRQKDREEIVNLEFIQEYKDLPVHVAVDFVMSCHTRNTYDMNLYLQDV